MANTSPITGKKRNPNPKLGPDEDVPIVPRPKGKGKKKKKHDGSAENLLKSKKKYGGKVVKRNMGGDLKSVDTKKNPGLAKLPTPVRNKMGFAKGGGKVKSPVVNKFVGGLIKGGVKAAMKAAGKGKEKVKRGVDKVLHYSADQGPKGAPGVTAGGRTSKSAVIGRKHVADYTRRRRAEGLKAGVPVGAGGSVLVDSMYDSKKKSKKAPSLGGKRQTEADRRKAILKKVQTPVDTVGGISKPKKKAAKAPLSKKKPIRLKKPKEGKSDSSVIVDYTVIDELKSGGKVKGYKKGGPITYRMTGGQVVGNSYD